MMVSGGKITMSVPARDALAVHVGAALGVSVKRGLGEGIPHLGRSGSDM